ncbi:MAG: PilZ domain-containing protein [Candidatus Omnitrophica bacterium]|nr:PilZ domain-containing protein [Candidatus Omnitrophota bacterium]
MQYPNRRLYNRVNFLRPILIIIDPQVSINGRLRDISTKAAFVEMKYNVYLKRDDELKFKIQMDNEDPESVIEGNARISRIAPGEGLAIYFFDLSAAQTKQLEQLVASNSSNGY